MEKLGSYVVENPQKLKGRWREVLAPKSGKVYLEIGCGKGDFIVGTAKSRPDDAFIAIEVNRSVILKALQKADALDIGNIRFIAAWIDDIGKLFEPGEIDGVYLNFSDPWPKGYAAKRRLTYRRKLDRYFELMTPGGTVEFKTDNDALFDFTVGEVLASDRKIIAMTRDLNAEGEEINGVMTEYEKKFVKQGKSINYIKIGRKDEEEAMAEKSKRSMAALNGRTVPQEDKIFGISVRAKKAEAEFGKDAVVNATIGALLSDDGELIVLSSVAEAVSSLKPAEFAEYAPISGIPAFKEDILKAVMGPYFGMWPFTSVVATPGGTGALRNMIANYSEPGDKILTHNWHWTPYGTIAAEQGRGLETFEMFDEAGRFNVEDFEYKVKKLLRRQDHLVIILNTPANNPTGYSLSTGDWDKVIEILNGTAPEKKVALVVDVAYIDFAGDEKETREFLPMLRMLHDNILVTLACSASKTFTFYGFRCGAIACLTKHKEIADEFDRVNRFSSRASWSNSPRAPQTVIAKIYEDPALLAKVDEERAKFRSMLISRGRAFEEEAGKVGLEIVPFRAGFFVSVPCDDPDAVSKRLEDKNIFLVPMSKGLRVSVASISEKKCKVLPSQILEAMDEVNG